MAFTKSLSTLCIFMFVALVVAPSFAQTLDGKKGASSGDLWQSSWLDLSSQASFRKGDRVRLRIEGVAENVLVRFLPSTATPDSMAGVDGGIRKVPTSRILEISLESDHLNTKQISVHAGKEAWGRHLGGGNGTALLVSIERLSK